MHGGTDSEGEPLYGAALFPPGPAEIERESHVNSGVFTVIVDISGAVGHYFVDTFFPSSNILYRITPTSVRLAPYSQLGKLC